jgi:hypothetical protein
VNGPAIYTAGELRLFCERAAQAAIDAALQAIDAEEEAPGPMPYEMWTAINGDRERTEEAIRTAIRLTKKGIRERLLGHEPQSGRDS